MVVNSAVKKAVRRSEIGRETENDEVLKEVKNMIENRPYKAIKYYEKFRKELSTTKDDELAKEALQNDCKAKAKMKSYADSKRKAQDSNLKVGDIVIRLENQRNKSQSFFNNIPYSVVKIKGTMCIIKNEVHTLAVDTSKLKLYNMISPKQKQGAQVNKPTRKYSALFIPRSATMHEKSDVSKQQQKLDLTQIPAKHHANGEEPVSNVQTSQLDQTNHDPLVENYTHQDTSSSDYHDLNTSLSHNAASETDNAAEKTETEDSIEEEIEESEEKAKTQIKSVSQNFSQRDVVSILNSNEVSISVGLRRNRGASGEKLPDSWSRKQVRKILAKKEAEKKNSCGDGNGKLNGDLENNGDINGELRRIGDINGDNNRRRRLERRKIPETGTEKGKCTGPPDLTESLTENPNGVEA
ncbi:hypothetical protein BpHYR1_001465 [Brachionus plicatilis]|uniref:Retrovirus-related Pol poly from transposon n=1 Tax=Brachionus plicatilis TaxID=10195 RepID=A0A3M7PS89_BRAPC|nr:hypothetical protein BpHYR1_001465 [Brachionus plicatilis]